MRLSKWILLSTLVAGFVAATVMLARPTPTSALPDYATKTGQACGVCHVNPAGGGPLTPRGTAFAAVPTHAADPAGAFTQSGTAAQATPTAAPAKPAATPTAAAPAASPTAAPAKPAASPTAAPAKPAASPTAAPAAPGALPRTGGFPVAPVAVSGGAFLAALGWSLRRMLKR